MKQSEMAQDRLPHSRAVADSRDTRRGMLEAMHALEESLASGAPRREEAWHRRVMGALADLREVMLNQTAELSAEEGLFAEIIQEHPRLEGRVRQLRQQYEDLVRQIAALREQFESPGESNVSEIRQRLAWLLSALRHFQAQESDLIYEAFNVDVGAID